MSFLIDKTKYCGGTFAFVLPWVFSVFLAANAVWVNKEGKWLRKVNLPLLLSSAAPWLSVVCWNEPAADTQPTLYWWLTNSSLPVFFFYRLKKWSSCDAKTGYCRLTLIASPKKSISFSREVWGPVCLLSYWIVSQVFPSFWSTLSVLCVLYDKVSKQ